MPSKGTIDPFCDVCGCGRGHGLTFFEILFCAVEAREGVEPFLDSVAFVLAM